MKLRDELRGIVPQDLLSLVPSGFDIIGSRSGAVAIIEIPNELDKFKYEIAKAIIKNSRNVKAVLRRIGPRSGEFRLYSYEKLIGEVTEVIHVESGIRLMLDPTKVFFSPRDQYDRLDLASRVKDNEVIAYLFAGIAPYAFIILKHKPTVRLIYAVEINPEAIRYAEVNVRLNKVRGKVVPVEYDASLFCEKMRNSFHRVIMTLPLGAHQYLPSAINCVMDEGIVNFYHIGPEEDPFRDAEEIVMKHCSNMSVNCRIINERIVREYAPRVYKVRVDFEVNKRQTTHT
ncbi:class I SAM-dependent methyltransferase family protein [Caldivirga sp.]|uniref:class I SAM-dependent methyltransferase n=1 Tax=Caldivirga sp. TaxID=2080243 RepID=UPI0025C40A7D|nr:class I SAM-dependent methyltransferase family protein [Caldivirga sp.]